MWNYFDRIYCINLASRTDRWQSSQREFDRVGMNVTRFDAVSGDNKHLAFNKSQHGVLTQALADGCNTFLVLEDDVEFKRYDHLRMALGELPNDWDMVYLGANLIGSDVMKFKRPVKTGQHTARIFDCWQTHAVAYSRKAAEAIVAAFNPDEFPIYDEWLRLNYIKDARVYIINPQVAIQSPGHSDIWSREVDYTHCFHQGNDLMSA